MSGRSANGLAWTILSIQGPGNSAEYRVAQELKQ